MFLDCNEIASRASVCPSPISSYISTPDFLSLRSYTDIDLSTMTMSSVVAALFPKTALPNVFPRRSTNFFSLLFHRSFLPSFLPSFLFFFSISTPSYTNIVDEVYRDRRRRRRKRRLKTFLLFPFLYCSIPVYNFHYFRTTLPVLFLSMIPRPSHIFHHPPLER